MTRFAEVDLSASQWTSIAGNWRRRDVDFVHEPEGVASTSFNLFASDKKIKDGAIEGTVRVSRGGDGGRLMFRYSPGGCYYAGVGGYRRHFAIVKHVRSGEGAVSVGIAVDGLEKDIRYDGPYHLRVEFIGDTITLKCAGVTVLEATDKWFQDGHIGIETYGQTRAEFSNLRAFEVPPLGNLLQVLEAFPYTLKRDLAHFKCELKNEKDVQRVLWAVLRSHYADLVDEEILGRFGLKHYQDDFGIPSLATIVEVKVVYEKTDLRDLQEQLMTDAAGYFATMTNYRHLVFFLYNKGNRLVDRAFVDALESLDPRSVTQVVSRVLRDRVRSRPRVNRALGDIW